MNSVCTRKRRKGKKGKKGDGTELSPEELARLEAERLEKVAQLEEEYKRKWIEDWENKIREQERDEDCQACCHPDLFFRHPRNQSNVWIQVNHEKSIQHVQMSFKNVPIPKPPPPPPPKFIPPPELMPIDDKKK